MAELRSGQRSRAMLLLRALVDIAPAHPALPGPLPSPRHAWHLLIEAERRSPAAVEGLLLHPTVGVWLNRCLRRLRGLESGNEPLWSTVGYLHAMAASAALLAGIDFRIAVPVRDRGVMLPALGFARIPHEADVVEVVMTDRKAAVLSGPHSVTLPADFSAEAPGWYGLRRLRGEHRGIVCAPLVDDIDPYRDFLRIRGPERLTDGERADWQERFDSAWRLVAQQPHVDPGGIGACLTSVVPVPYVAWPEPFSASSPEAYGCVLLGGATDALALATALVHEAQHIKLSALMDLVPLIEHGLEEVHYAPWRLDPRPLRGLLQGVYAFLGVTGFWQDRMRRAEAGPARSTAAFEFALRRAQTSAGLRTLLSHAQLTPTGREFLHRLEERLAEWLVRPVPALPGRLAADLIDDHRIVHRMRHLRPDPGQLARWARAWRERTAPPREPPGTSVRPAPTEALTRPALARHRLRDPAGFARLRAGGGAGTPDGGDAPDRADLDWAAGDTAAALRGYRGRVEADPEDIAAWAGLALSLPAGTARTTLLSHPELVLAVHREVRTAAGTGPDPVSLARWIGTRTRR
ncbi:HEXXH motif domain-containing protein [Streptomyces luomodiensis]|uniref:HEXXH motif domain-containing protein n=1 Tax=Streptomyces luomodiensis TaxID=3026192 RepID=A0ABY9URX0_9ACTN|nr:HEXXH motif domain-containing protein [Streptomyces sp. SCA4-21]WNE94702.1 HEXXH motif domain-containing protein [Streptomyces sp. SCA4-21]